LSCRRSKPRCVLVVHGSESHHLIRKVLKSPF
jgi:DNA-nicking Smr family endonuclease